jgi:hypothetical protein
MSTTVPGIEATIVDEPNVGPGAPTATDTLFLISADTAAPAVPTEISNATQMRVDYPTGTTLWAEVDAFLNESATPAGGSRVIAVQLVSGLSGLADTLALLPASLGPGQVVAPTIVAASDHADIAEWALATNRTFLANGPSAATDAALITIASTIQASGFGRCAGLFADTAIIPGVGASTRQVPWAVVAAGIIARNDILTGNPNLAPAGNRGIAVYALGILDERTDAEMTTLNAAAVNVARAPVGGAPRTFGFKSLADPDTLPQWVQLTGYRVVMDILANSAAASGSILFDQLDAKGLTLAKWHGLLATRCLELLRVGALFGNELTAFTVDTGPGLNSPAQIALGRAQAGIKLKTSPYAEQLDIAITKQPIA